MTLVTMSGSARFLSSRLSNPLRCHPLSWRFHLFHNPESLRQDFDENAIRDVLKRLIFASQPDQLPLVIHSVNAWTMSAQVAASFSNAENNAFLVGDAAHRFPPAGGFGMNTGMLPLRSFLSTFTSPLCSAGIQDAHNLAWKVAAVYHKQAGKELLRTYEEGLARLAYVDTLLLR